MMEFLEKLFFQRAILKIEMAEKLIYTIAIRGNKKITTNNT